MKLKVIPKRNERKQRVCHQLHTAGYAEERCEKSELVSSELVHSIGIVPRLTPPVRPLSRMSAGKAWFQ